MAEPEVPRPSFYRWPIRILALAIVAVFIYRMTHEPPHAGPGRTPVPESDTAVTLLKEKQVPPFTLTERSGKIITNRDLAGKVWVADFIFTTCPGPCPLITANMAKIQELVAHDPRVQLVSFTVDPQTDTPPVLSAYADKFGADPYRWWFLTGPEKPLYDLIQNGFNLYVKDNRNEPPQQGQFVVTHQTQLVLVDGNGWIRGYYNGDHDVAESRERLLHDIALIEKEQP